MKNKEIKIIDSEVRQVAKECVQLLRSVDFEQLGISSYNLEYVQRLLPNLEYYFRIYTDALLILLKREKTIPASVVDFGGGHGFLSIFLKKLGFEVIYCDHNPLSIKAATLLKEKLNVEIDHLIEGSSAELQAYCTVNKLKPNYLIATDVIEHVYDLNIFFANLYQINPKLKMIFTTGSNPSNPYKVRNLRKAMANIEKSLYFPMRRDYIQKNYPTLTEWESADFARLTRGLTYQDISGEMDIYLQKGTLPKLRVDSCNTCDPQTGNWTERILSLKEYRNILNKNGFKAEFLKGYYNEKRNVPIQLFAAKIINKFVKYSFSVGRTFCAYLIIKVIPKN